MKLIDFDGQDFKIADEALLIRPIRELFRKDKSKNKEEFWRQISYLWFMCDPRSTYMYLMNETERAREVRKQEGFPANWKPTPLLEEAMDVYRTQSTTTASLLLEDMRFALDSIRLIIRRIGESFRSTEDGDDNNTIDIKLDKALEAMTKAADKIPELAKKLSDSEKALVQDFASEDSARGGVQKAIGEDI